PRFHYSSHPTGLRAALTAFFRPIVAGLLTMDPVPRALLVGGLAGLLTTFILYIGSRDRPWSRRRRLAQAALWGALVASVIAGLMLFGGQLLEWFGFVVRYLGPV